MSRSDIVEEINDLDIKIAKTHKRIQEKQLKLERLTEKRVAKETGQSSQTPSSPEDLVISKPKILDQGIQKIESAYKASNPYYVPEAHKCYVIFAGPKAGVYREWSTVQPLVSATLNFPGWQESSECSPLLEEHVSILSSSGQKSHLWSSLA
ncbi:hypothetical protein D5086_027768 [Populus alba]|uniref:Uncharacterized protein n=1 Tax=Populus alba TaxID=43335 RepID=A0ACC4AW98_POPAL